MRPWFFKTLEARICWLWVFTLWVMPALAQSAEKPPFEKQARQVLRSHLEKAEELQVETLLEELAQKTDLPREQVRVRLSVWLDTLDVWRKQQRSEWKKLVKSGGAQTSAKEAEKFLRQFLGQARQTLEKQKDRPLEDLVDQAAKKAQVLTYQGRDLLLKLLSEEFAAPLPDKVGLLVEVRSQLKDDNVWMFYTIAPERGDDNRFDALLRPVVIRELGRSPRVRWIIEQPKPALQPDCRLVLELEQFENRANGEGWLISGQVIIYETKNQEELYRRPLQAKYLYSSDEKPQERADKFLGDIALKTRGIFEEYWTSK